MIGRMFEPEHQSTKPKLDLNSYFVFDVNPEFGRSVPLQIVKRLGKFHRHPVFPSISSDKVEQLAEMLERNSKRRELIAMFSMAREQQPEDEKHQDPSDEDSDE